MIKIGPLEWAMIFQSCVLTIIVISWPKITKAWKHHTKPVSGRDKETVQGFISANISKKAMVYTDDHRSYNRTSFEHESVNHSV